jgi:NAD(P)H-dependent FMN reductase
VRALILNGAVSLRDMGQTAESALAAELTSRDYAVVRRDLTSLEIPDCRGDFGCWTVTPGVCVHAGPHRDVARELAQSNLVVWLTPVTFGGYSSALKRQLDHCVPLVSPHFTTVGGETHHEPRYERFPSLLAVGLVEQKRAEEVRVFERLVRRNALNMYAPRFASPVLARRELPELQSRLARWLDDLAASQAATPGGEPLDLDPRADLPRVRPGRALLLVGSPRGSESTSAGIAAYLKALLEGRGLVVATERIRGRALAEPDPAGLCAQMKKADVVALVTPLYVDSLPAPVTEAFEVLARDRQATAWTSRPRFLAIANSGFPEAVHNDTALAICRQFAEQAGLDWIGGLGIGAGGMLGGAPLSELGGRARAVTTALALTADAIARGEVVPEEARRLVAKLPIPKWLYRFFGEWGFRQDAKRHGTLKRLGERPYAA